jgi:hypothetical protein
MNLGVPVHASLVVMPTNERLPVPPGNWDPWSERTAILAFGARSEMALGTACNRNAQ